MMTGILTVKWEQHIPCFMQGLQEAILNGLHSDVTVACDQKIYKLHKLILSCYSDFFAKIFKEVNETNPVIILRDTPSNEFEAILQYIYVGQVKIESHMLNSFIATGVSLDIKGLVAKIKFGNELPVQTMACSKDLIQIKSVNLTNNQYDVCQKIDPIIDNKLPHIPIIDNKLQHIPIIDNKLQHIPIIDNKLQHIPIIDNKLQHTPIIDNKLQLNCKVQIPRLNTKMKPLYLLPKSNIMPKKCLKKVRKTKSVHNKKFTNKCRIAKSVHRKILPNKCRIAKTVHKKILPNNLKTSISPEIPKFWCPASPIDISNPTTLPENEEVYNRNSCMYSEVSKTLHPSSELDLTTFDEMKEESEIDINDANKMGELNEEVVKLETCNQSYNEINSRDEIRLASFRFHKERRSSNLSYDNDASSELYIELKESYSDNEIDCLDEIDPLSVSTDF